MKGQIEFMAILGIIALLIVVVYYAYSTGNIFPSPVPQAVGEEQKVVGDTVANVGREGAGIAIKWLEQQGGFITPNINNSVVFTKVAVPYWQKCGDSSMKPTLGQITERLEQYVKGYINYSLYNKKEYFGKNVSFDLERLSVSANILNNKVDFAVSLPTTVQGYAVQQPFTFSIPTKLGEIYDFGRRFVEDNARNRMLEHFTIATIYFSGELETQGALTQCGESIYQSGDMISNGLRNAITYTLANTLWWQTIPEASVKSKSYSIESVGGKKYPQLDIGFYLPDNFTMGPSSPLSVSNNMHVAKALIFDIPVCIAVYNWKYSVNYPVVVRVEDGLTGGSFNFAVLVEVDEMKPGGCKGIEAGGMDIAMDCSADIRVLDSSGGPVEGANANFAGIFIGRSDSNGMIRGKSVCGPYELAIYKEGYSMLKSENITSINGTYTLHRQPVLDMNFSVVEIGDVNGIAYEPDGAARELKYSVCSVGQATKPVWMNFSSNSGSYVVSNADTEGNIVDCSASANCMACRTSSDAAACKLCTADCSVGTTYKPSASIEYLAEGSYMVDAGVMDGAKTKMEGGFFSVYEVPRIDASLNVYIPLNSSLSSYISGRAELAGNLRLKCGVEPIATVSYNSLINITGCSCTQLKAMAEREFGSCINAAEMFQNLSSSSWSCAKQNVISAVNNCGFELRGC